MAGPNATLLKRFGDYVRSVSPKASKKTSPRADVDRYLFDVLVLTDPVLDAALQASRAAGLPPINVSPNQGKLLMLLARAIGAHSILEIGTLGGYSTIWLARALAAGGRLITLEAEPIHAEVARANVALAGLADRVELRLGLALGTLPTLAADGPFDLIFIDADNENLPEYFQWALKLSRQGSLIIVDNVVPKVITNAGAPIFKGGFSEAVRRFYDLVASDPKVSMTAIQTVGVKGRGGLAIALVGA
jgi:predicted O-methyltransferase YrrM